MSFRFDVVFRTRHGDHSSTFLQSLMKQSCAEGPPTSSLQRLRICSDAFQNVVDEAGAFGSILNEIKVSTNLSVWRSKKLYNSQLKKTSATYYCIGEGKRSRRKRKRFRVVVVSTQSRMLVPVLHNWPHQRHTIASVVHRKSMTTTFPTCWSVSRKTAKGFKTTWNSFLGEVRLRLKHWSSSQID